MLSISCKGVDFHAVRDKVRIMTKFTDTLTETITDQVQIATTAINVANTRMLDTVVEANRTAVGFAVKSAERLPALDLPVEMPVEFPTPAEAGERYIDFVERAVSMNRELNERVIKMLPADVKPTAKRTSKKVASKPAAKKAGAKNTKASAKK